VSSLVDWIRKAIPAWVLAEACAAFFRLALVKACQFPTTMRRNDARLAGPLAVLAAVGAFAGSGWGAGRALDAAQAPATTAARAGTGGSQGRGECLSIESQILGGPVPYCVLLPPSYDAATGAGGGRSYPVLYFLHGLGDNEQMFFRSGAWDLVQDLWQRKSIGEYVIVTPRGGTSFYINSRDGRQRYEDFLVRELMPAVEERFRIRAGRQFRGVAGISMGGYGALRLAFRHPDLFGSVSAHSAALIDQLPAITDSDPGVFSPLRLLGDVFGSPVDRGFWDANNPLTIARTANIEDVKIYFDCGENDDFGFEAGAGSLHALLNSRHIVHEFHLYPGGHNWEYFAAHLPASLAFESAALGAAPPAARTGAAKN